GLLHSVASVGPEQIVERRLGGAVQEALRRKSDIEEVGSAQRPRVIGVDGGENADVRKALRRGGRKPMLGFSRSRGGLVDHRILRTNFRYVRGRIASPVTLRRLPWFHNWHEYVEAFHTEYYVSPGSCCDGIWPSRR